MLEKAREILDFLPIRQEIVEGEYVDHLWSSFLVLDDNDSLARSFVVMPFHLLFMLAIQNKVLRIYREEENSYLLSFTLFNFDKNCKDVLKPTSPFALAVLNESQIVDLLKLVNLDPLVIKKAKLLIRNRNENLAHAKGGIERNPDSKIEDYLSVLYEIQKKIDGFNLLLFDKWIKEIKQDDDLNDFIESSLLESGVCRQDFLSGSLKIFTVLSHELAENLEIDLSDMNYEEWLYFFKIGLDKIPFQAVKELEYLIQLGDEEKKFNAVQLLLEYNKLSEEIRDKILESKDNHEIKSLLSDKPSNDFL